MENHLYQVDYGDSLCKISQKTMGDPNRWTEIATLNHIDSPESFYIGQELQIPYRNRTIPMTSSPATRHQENSSSSLGKFETTYAYGRSLFFMIADEFDLSNPTYVRRVAVPEDITDPKILRRILSPEVYGFSPRDSTSNVSVAGHVTGRTDSKFVSVSTLEEGATRHGDKVFYIDKTKLKNEVVELDTIIHEMNTKITKLEAELTRATQNKRSLKSIEVLQDKLNRTYRSLKQAIGDAENLVIGNIPPSLIKSAKTLKADKVLRFVAGINILFTTIDYTKATKESIEKSSLNPLRRETMRQIGGRTGNAIGFWAGFRIGAGVGSTFTLELGPGALAGGVAGGVVFGAMGYFGSDYLANYLYPDPVK